MLSFSSIEPRTCRPTNSRGWPGPPGSSVGGPGATLDLAACERLGVQVIRGAQHGDEDLRRPGHLAGRRDQQEDKCQYDPDRQPIEGALDHEQPPFVQHQPDHVAARGADLHRVRARRSGRPAG